MRFCILLAPFSNPASSTITYDSLVRAGIQATSAGVSIDSHAVCTRGVKIIPDVLLDDLSDDDLVGSYRMTQTTLTLTNSAASTSS